MARSQAQVPTPNASRYLVQLSKHWAHRFDVHYDQSNSRIPFDAESVCTLAATDEELTAVLDAPDSAIERLQGVVADHLNRFAFREGELRFDWRRIDQAA